MQLGLVTQAVKEAADRLDANPKVDEFEAFLKKYSAVLHQNHVILIDKKYTLAKMYGRMEGKLQHLAYFFKYSFCELPTKKVLACLFMTKIDNKQTRLVPIGPKIQENSELELDIRETMWW